ncbi:MAG: HAD hydrolase family protein [Actinomycetes bacterium]
MSAQPGSRPAGVQAVYSDLDGTMVGPYGCFFREPGTAPTLEPAQALVDLLRAELTLVLVSGRTRPQLEEACRIFGADGYVGELGAVLGWDHGLESTVLHGAMPDEYTATPWQVMHDTGVATRLLDRYAGRLELHAPWHEGHEADVMVRGRVDVVEVEQWLAGIGFGWLRLRDNGVLPGLVLPDVGGPVHVYHLMPDGLTKGLGVAEDMRRRGLAPEQAVAIGDSASDLAMAPYVRRFFLVANGADSPTTAEMARTHDNLTVCSGANGLGWAEAVRWALGSTAP